MSNLLSHIGFVEPSMARRKITDLPVNTRLKPSSFGCPKETLVYIIGKTKEEYTSYSVDENGAPKLVKNIGYYAIVGFSDARGAYSMRYHFDDVVRAKASQLASEQVLDACFTFSYYQDGLLVETLAYNEGQKCSMCNGSLVHANLQQNIMCDFCSIMNSL